MNAPDTHADHLAVVPYPEIGDLDEWLHAATRGLCDAAKEKIREEIADHYFATVQDRVSEGVALEEAQLLALASLGSPYHARRGFKKAYPTQAELDEWQTSPWKKHWWILIHFYAFSSAITTGYMALNSVSPELVQIGIGFVSVSLVVLLIGLMALILPSKSMRRPFIFRMSFIMALLLQSWCMALTAIACDDYALLLMLIVLNALMPYGFWRLYQQMKRIERVASGVKIGGLS
ncbi:MAG: hypothetical protein IT368_05040 [Candidatus Hydrogenedentes bacterium]|nr:hypothetical protein [Candidatus Hydrogenedentota bacterium]